MLTNGMFDAANKIDNAAKYCAKAINASTKIKTKPGYLPFVQNSQINEVVYKNMLKYCKPEQIKKGSKSIAASDLGDVSAFVPSIEFGYGGFKGVAHSKDVEIIDENRVYIETSKLLIDIVSDLLQDKVLYKAINKSFKFRISKKDYSKYLSQK